MDIALILEGEFEVVGLLSPGAKGRLSRVKAKIARSRPTILVGKISIIIMITIKHGNVMKK